jgi:micrococcal nuclease
LLGQARLGQLTRLAVAPAALTLAAAGCADDSGDGAARGSSRFPPPPRSALSARVMRVVDGDTAVLSGIGKVRLIGVETPEVFGGVECYGREASAFAKRVLEPGRRVSFRLGIEPRDRYGRALAYVWLRDGRLFNASLVEAGYAVPLTIPPNVDYAEAFVAAARRARRAGRGLWSRRTCGGDDV